MDPTAATVVTVACVVNFLIGVRLLIGQREIAQNQIELSELIRDPDGRRE